MKHNSTLNSADLGIALIRAVLAVVFIYHGSQKLFGWFGGYGVSGTAGFFAQIGIPMPRLSVYLAAGTEFFGGIVLILGSGLLGRAVATIMAFNMAVAIATVHLHAFGTQNKGMEFPLTLGVVCLALAFTGFGQLTLVGLLLKPKGKPVPEGFELAN